MSGGSGFDRLGANARNGARGLVAPAAETGGNPPKPAEIDKAQRRAESRGKGYTGDACPRCQQLTLKIAGHCYVCETCGETTGCS